MKPSRKSGFTLIEIMVVLVLATILSSITFGAFRSISQGNKRTTCQSNLSQIYKSARLYAQDYNGKFPYLNAGDTIPQPNNATPANGIGLWTLYTFPKKGANNCTPNVPADTATVTGYNTDYNTDLSLPLASDDGTQLTGYVRSAKIFHCPADRFDKQIQLEISPGTCATPTVPTASLTVKEGNSTYLNPSYLSYQTVDDMGPTPRDTYSSFRASGSKRQLIYFTTNTSGVTRTPERPTEDTTVVTWCRFHRSLDNTGATVAGPRNYDNVLFYDGTVQAVPSLENINTFVACDTLSPTCVGGWQRVPKRAG